MTRRPTLLLAALALGLGALLHGSTPTSAQQPDPPFRAIAGRFVPGPLASGPLCVLDTWTGRIHVAPSLAIGEGVKAWVVDLPEATLWERPLARDVSAGHVLQHAFPVSGQGAGGPVFAWHPVESMPGALDTRTGAHYSIFGPVGPGCSIIRTDLRLLTRSTREARTAGD